MNIIGAIIKFFHKEGNEIKREDLLRYLEKYYSEDVNTIEYYIRRIHIKDETTRVSLYSLFKNLKKTHRKFSGMQISRMSKDEMFNLLYKEIYQ